MRIFDNVQIVETQHNIVVLGFSGFFFHFELVSIHTVWFGYNSMHPFHVLLRSWLKPIYDDTIVLLENSKTIRKQIKALFKTIRSTQFIFRILIEFQFSLKKNNINWLNHKRERRGKKTRILNCVHFMNHLSVFNSSNRKSTAKMPDHKKKHQHHFCRYNVALAQRVLQMVRSKRFMVDK